MVDITITPGNVVKGGNALTEDGHAGEAVTAGQVVYKDPATGKYLKAAANGANATVRTPRGIALNGASDNQPLQIQRNGNITIGATLTAGTTYYLSNTGGGICPVADVGVGEFFAIIGIATSTSALKLSLNYSGVSA